MSQTGSRKRGRTNAHRRRRRGLDPMIWIVGTAGVLITLVLIGAWQNGAFARQPELSSVGDTADLLPLSQIGQPLWGGHDMSLIPRETPAPKAAPADGPGPRADIPSASYNFGAIYDTWDVSHVFAIQNTGD